MQKMEQAIAAPGCCFVCRSSNREWYIDLNMNIDLMESPQSGFYGAMYLCDQCVIEAAHLADMLTKFESDNLRVENKLMGDDIFDLRIKVSGLEQAIDGLRLAGSVVGFNSNTNNLVPPGVSPEESLDKRAELVSGEGESSESLHDEGLADFPATTVPDTTFKLF